MPYSRPTLTDLRQQVASDIASNLPGADGLLRFSNLSVIGQVQAGMANLHYGYLDWIAKQAVPWTSSDEFLQGWAALIGVFPSAATTATGTVTFNGNNGVALPSGTTMVRGDQRTYVSTADGVVSGGVVTVPVVDQTPGAAGNSNTGTVLTLGTGIDGIQSNGAVATALTGGADVESQDSLKTAMLHKFQNPPQGGSQQDYVTWALDVSGVTRAWALGQGQGAGTVVVYFMMDVSEAAHNGFPQGTNGTATGESRDSNAAGDQLIVANFIFPLQPVTALIYACAPQAAAQNFTIAGLNPSNPTMKAAVSAAIADVFVREGSPLNGTVYMADINAAIDAIPGIIDFIITSPTTDITTSTGFLPTVGTITWA